MIRRVAVRREAVQPELEVPAVHQPAGVVVGPIGEHDERRAAGVSREKASRKSRVSDVTHCRSS